MIPTKTLTALLLSALAFAATPTGISPGDPCVDVGNASACGHAEVVGCGVASAAGQATGIVTWKFVVWTTSSFWGPHSTTHTLTSPSYGNTLTDYCATDTCTYAALYANDVLVHQATGVCIQA